MSRQCELCLRGTVTANTVSHSNIKTKSRQMVNLKTIRAIVDGQVRRVRVCTSCMPQLKRPPIR